MVHLHATGLGPVTRPQQTAVPASGPVPLVEQRPCTDGGTLLYAGLAPGLTGYRKVLISADGDGLGGSASIIIYDPDGYH